MNFKNVKTSLVMCTAIVLVGLSSCKKSKASVAEDKKEVTVLYALGYRPISSPFNFDSDSYVLTNTPIDFSLDLIRVEEYVENEKDKDGNVLTAAQQLQNKCKGLYSTKVKNFYNLESNKAVFAQQLIPGLSNIVFHFSAAIPQETILRDQLLKSTITIDEIDANNQLIVNTVILNVGLDNILKEVIRNEKYDPNKPEKGPEYYYKDMNGNDFDKTKIAIQLTNRRVFTIGNLTNSVQVSTVVVAPPMSIFEGGKRYKISLSYLREDGTILNQYYFYEQKLGYYCMLNNDPLSKTLDQVFAPNSDYWKGTMDFNTAEWMQVNMLVK